MEKLVSITPVSRIVLAICPECMLPSAYDFGKKKWVCLGKDEKHEFDWIEDGKKYVWETLK